MGVPDELFWRSTPNEVTALVEEILELRRASERANNRRAGLVAASIYNVRRTEKSDPLVHPDDFFRDRDQDEEPERMDPMEAVQHFTAWAQGRNQSVH